MGILSLLRNKNILSKNISVSRKQEMSSYSTGNVFFCLFLSDIKILQVMILLVIILLNFSSNTPRAMDEGSEVMEDIVFRGVEFSVKIEVDNGLLIVEINDLMTADQWRGDFDPACKLNTFIKD